METLLIAHDRPTLMSRLRQARAHTDEIFAIVRPEAIYSRPIAERHRIVFYVGHVEAFDWNLLREPCGLVGQNPQFDRLFAFGIDPVDGNLPSDEPEDWPTHEEVIRYRDRVRSTLDCAIENLPEPDLLLNVAIEHRLMHAETLAYMFHQLTLEQKSRQRVRRTLQADASTPDSVPIPAGKATLGLHRDAGAFGWCNEFEQHTIHVPAFSVDRYKVTNGQFLEFIEQGGYGNRDLWTAADWEWRTNHSIAHPVFWLRRDGEWFYRSMFDELPLPLDWPVYVSHAEASAYARWHGKALPSEAQWHRASQGLAYPDDDPAVDIWDPAPVQSPALGASDFGIHGLAANGWEWTSTEFHPFPGFEPYPFYPGYSANFFDGQHYVLKGGSVRTAACMLRPSFRNWFQPRYQFVYAGFRCVGGERC